MAEDKQAFHRIVADKLIAQLQQGTAPWQKPWEAGAAGSYVPHNAATGNRYRGINAIQLLAEDREDPRWMTYRQAQAAGAQVRKGEKGTLIQYWRFTEERPKLDAQGKPVLDAEGNPEKEIVKLERPKVFRATVFNAEQIEGLPPWQRRPPAWDPSERAETILKASGATLRHDQADRAFYRPGTDSIHLPGKEQFASADRYYATALHELGHWTGHPSRLDRDLAHPFGSEGYAREELRAEIASLILGDDLGIGHDPGQHAAYVGSWIKALREDPMEIFRAAADAEQIQGYVLGLEQRQVLEQDRTQAEAPAIPEPTPAPPTLAQGLPRADVAPLGIVIGQAISESRDRADRLGLTARIERLAFEGFSAGEIGRTLQPQLAEIAGEGLAPFVRRVRASLGIPSQNDPETFQTWRDRVAPRLAGSTAGRDGLPRIDTSALGGLGAHIEEARNLADRLGLTAQIERLAFEGLTAAQIARELDAQLDPVKQAALEEQKNPAAEAAYFVRQVRASLGIPSRSDPEAFESWRSQAAPRLGSAGTLGVGHPTEQAQRPSAAPMVEALLAGDPDRAFRLMAETAEAIQQDVLGLERGQVQQQGETVARDTQQTFDRRPPHEMTLAEFSSQATVEPLTNHGRKWNVTLGDRYAAFSDADSPAHALADVHRLEVNNALLLNTPDYPVVYDKPTVPPAAVLAEYPDLISQYPQVRPPEAETRTYLDVPYRQKEAVKALGARWDRQEQSWYVPAGIDPAPFSRWAAGAGAESPEVPEQSEARDRPPPRRERHYLAVPYGEREAAKAAGARWDQAAKSWYAGPDADRARLERWNPDKIPEQQGPALAPREEFTEALRSLGALVTGDHPVMDGRKHRIEVEGDRKGEKAGFYVGHLDGHPAGFIQNNRTGAAMNWKSRGYALDPAQRARLHAEAAEKLQARAIEQERLHEATAERIGRQLENLAPVTAPTPYLDAKGIKPRPGVFTDRDGRETYVPAHDVQGKLWTMQYVQEDGTKRFAKDSRKEGCFHVVGGGGLDALKKAPVLVIGEGYATAASLSEALGQPTVAAFDAGNLPHVAKALRARFPDKPVIIAGDDDRHLERTQGRNPGRSKAQEAAQAVGGEAVFPVFAPGEREGNPKGFTDFNDLAVRSRLGREAIERQLRPVVEKAIERQRNRGMDARQAERTPKQEREPRTLRR